MDLRRARLGGLLRIHHHRQRLVVDLDQVERVARDKSVLGHHHRHRIADETDLAHRQRAWRVDVVRDPASLPGAGQRVDIHHIFAGDHGDDAGQRLGLRGVDALDVGMGVGTAQNGGVRHAMEFDIVEVVTFAGDQLGIFAALERLPDHSSHCIGHDDTSFVYVALDQRPFSFRCR